MDTHEPPDISFFFVSGELIASFIAIFLSFGPLIFKVSQRALRSNGFKEGLIYWSTLCFWIAIVLKAAIKLTVWTNMWISVSSCNPFWKSTVILDIPCMGAMEYCIVSKFEDKRTMQWVNGVMAIFIISTFFHCFWTIVTAEECIRQISGVGITGKVVCSRHEGASVAGQQQQIITVIYCVVHYVVAMLLSGIFLRRIYSVVFKQSPESQPLFHRIATPQKFQRMEKAMNKVIRHCILTVLLSVALILQISLQICGFIDFADSLWIDLFGGFVLFWYFPFADAHYQRYFGWIQRRIFAKWFISKVEDPSKCLLMLQTQHRKEHIVESEENEDNDNVQTQMDIMSTIEEQGVSETVIKTITLLSVMNSAEDEDQRADIDSLSGCQMTDSNKQLESLLTIQ